MPNESTEIRKGSIAPGLKGEEASTAVEPTRIRKVNDIPKISHSERGPSVGNSQPDDGEDEVAYSRWADDGGNNLD